MTYSGQQADALFQQAYEKYSQEFKIKLGKHEALHSWGYTLDAQAKTKSGVEAAGLFHQAHEKYVEVVKIKPDYAFAHFNLACLPGIQNDITTCREHLSNWQKHEPNAKKETLDAEPDFDRVRNTPEFLKFRDSLPA